MKMSNFKTMIETEIRLGVDASFDSILTNIMLLRIKKLKTVLENAVSLLKTMTSSMLVDMLIFYNKALDFNLALGLYRCKISSPYFLPTKF